MKCQICKKAPSAWAWQPLGPAENADCFVTLGSHTRGFALFKICQSCYAQIKTGMRFQFDYKDVTYAGTIQQVEECHE